VATARSGRDTGVLPAAALQTVVLESSVVQSGPLRSRRAIHDPRRAAAWNGRFRTTRRKSVPAGVTRR